MLSFAVLIVVLCLGLQMAGRELGEIESAGAYRVEDCHRISMNILVDSDHGDFE